MLSPALEGFPKKEENLELGSALPFLQPKFRAQEHAMNTFN